MLNSESGITQDSSKNKRMDTYLGGIRVVLWLGAAIRGMAGFKNFVGSPLEQPKIATACDQPVGLFRNNC